MRRFLSLLITATLSLSLLVPLASLAAPAKLRFANFPAASTFPCISMERWAEELMTRTNGAVTIETFPGGTLLDAKNMVRGVMQGQADIGCISLAYHPGAYPFLSVFELPLGFRSAEAASEVMWDSFVKHQPAEVSKVKVIALFASAPSQILSARPVNRLADLKGLTIRSSGILADMTQAMGASPVSMPQSDTPEALQKGVVQGVFTSFDVLKDYNFAESCRYGLIVDGPVYPFMFFMNMKKWNALDAPVQEAIMELAREHSIWTGKYVDGHGKAAVEWSEQTYGYKLATISQEERGQLTVMGEPVLAAWKEKAASRGIDAPALLQEVMAAKERVEQ